MSLKKAFFTAIAVGFCSGVAAEPIHEAALKGDIEAVRLLLSEGTPVDQFDTTDSYGRETTALYKATMAGRTEVVELLLDAGADPTLRSSDSQSILHPMQVAAKFGRAEILQMFLEHGADPNAPGKESTALHLAITSQKPEIEDILRKSGALPRIEQPSIVSQLSNGDPERGQQVFVEKCRSCHHEPRPEDYSTSKDKIANLWDVVGRDIASLDGTLYSEAMKSIEGKWTFDRLNSFMALPGGFVPGTAMEYPPHYSPPGEQDRIDVIAYLRTRSDDPVLLPQ